VSVGRAFARFRTVTYSRVAISACSAGERGVLGDLGGSACKNFPRALNLGPKVGGSYILLDVTGPALDLLWHRRPGVGIERRRPPAGSDYSIPGVVPGMAAEREGRTRWDVDHADLAVILRQFAFAGIQPARRDGSDDVVLLELLQTHAPSVATVGKPIGARSMTIGMCAESSVQASNGGASPPRHSYRAFAVDALDRPDCDVLSGRTDECSGLRRGAALIVLRHLNGGTRRRIHAFRAGGRLTARVTANGPTDCGVRRTSANVSTQSVGERGRLRPSANSVESA
jgi:hypothetical protein